VNYLLSENCCVCYSFFFCNYSETFDYDNDTTLANVVTFLCKEGNDVVLVANTCGVWTVSAVRVVYVIEENQMDISPWKRFGFANGTLEDHVETGEERFLLEWNTETDDVFYDILSFSRQNSWFTKFAFPVARYFQKCFADDSSKAMMDWIENGQEARKNGVSIV